MLIKKLNPDNILLIICLLTFNGAGVYFLYALNNKGIIFAFVLTLIEYFVLNYFFVKNLGKRAQKQSLPSFSGWAEKISLLLYFLTWLSLIYLLVINRSSLSLVSPWQVLPNYFFALFALASFLLVWLTINLRKKTLPLIIAHSFLILTVAVIIYQVGYGFDPFIHQATIKLIAKKGAVEPKPLYYLGQYSLEVIVYKLTHLPINWLDKLLLPLLAAVFLPLEFFRTFQTLGGQKLAAFLTALVMVLPFSFLIVTTPQNLAYFFLLLAIVRSLNIKNKFDLILITSLAIAALVTQPIAGLPAIFFSLLLWLNYLNFNKKIKIWLTRLLWGLAGLSLPLAFWFLNQACWQQIKLNLSLPRLKFFWPQYFYPFLNPVYLWGKNFGLIYFVVFLAGLFLAQQSNIISKEKRKIYLGLSFVLFLSYLFVRALPFNFLISYERLNYANRLLFLSALFALPFILVLLIKFVQALENQNYFTRLSWLIFIASLLTANFYLSYPRQDPYFNSRSYSTSIYDLQAVAWIENNAGNNDYIVLANQQVSAAALNQFGFKKYYSPKNTSFLKENKSKISSLNNSSFRILHSKLFYYPIPTASPLYAYYLDMIYKKPSRQTMQTACQLVGAKQGYFVVNKYWWAFDKVVKEAKLEADNWAKFGPNEVYIFVYRF